MSLTDFCRIELENRKMKTRKRGKRTRSPELKASAFLYDDLICTTPRLCQNNMTPVALRGRGTTSAYNCFPTTGLYFRLVAGALNWDRPVKGATCTMKGFNKQLPALILVSPVGVQV